MTIMATRSTEVVKDGGKRRLKFDRERLYRFIERMTQDVHLAREDIDTYTHKTIRMIERRQQIEAREITRLLKLNALERIHEQTPDWTKVARNVLLNELYHEAARNRGYDPKRKYGNLRALIQKLAEQGIYNPELLKSYDEDEMRLLEQEICSSADKRFDYLGLLLLSERYLVRDFDRRLYELPQERYMIAAMDLMRREAQDKRLEYVKELYWALSGHYLTLATPTLRSAGLKHAQYASCYVDTVDDSLRGIYDSNTDVAELSKNGAGLGIFIGSVRAKGSDIRGYKQAASGIMGWLKQLDNTARTVNQLGVRKGAIAVYLQVWHRDIFDFLDMKLNTGDDAMRCHHLFHGVLLNDLFMEKVEKREDWYLFCPHEIRRTMGWSLEDFYDEERGKGSFREKYEQCVIHPDLPKQKVPAIEIYKRILNSRLETGTPYMIFIDEVNRQNPNKHAGMIRSSNLCTEIMQNMSATTFVEESLDEDGTITIKKKAGDFVTCNLSSISLAPAVRDGVLERVVRIQMRALDNVIDLNHIPVKQAQWTNQKYRAVGSGVMGHAHLLALEGIPWESEQAVEYVDRLHEDIAYYVFRASMELAKEKGAYPLFKGSEYESGEYFRKRGYNSERWQTLIADIQRYGLRNGWLMATAPTGSISVINGTTAGIDPVFKTMYYEEKKDYKVPVVVPDLNERTRWLYKSAFHIDQKWSIRQNAKRQKHVDQAISFNLYLNHSITAKEILELDLLAWKLGLKSLYYTRTQSLEAAEECDHCSG